MFSENVVCLAYSVTTKIENSHLLGQHPRDLLQDLTDQSCRDPDFSEACRCIVDRYKTEPSNRFATYVALSFLNYDELDFSSQLIYINLSTHFGLYGFGIERYMREIKV